MPRSNIDERSRVRRSIYDCPAFRGVYHASTSLISLSHVTIPQSTPTFHLFPSISTSHTGPLTPTTCPLLTSFSPSPSPRPTSIHLPLSPPPSSPIFSSTNVTLSPSLTPSTTTLLSHPPSFPIRPGTPAPVATSTTQSLTHPAIPPVTNFGPPFLCGENSGCVSSDGGGEGERGGIVNGGR